MMQGDGFQGQPSTSASEATPTRGTILLSETTIFEKFRELPLQNKCKPRHIDECTYLVTCNLRDSDLAVAEVEYWGRFTDVVRKTTTGQVGLAPFNEFMARVFFELRVQTLGGRPDHIYDVVVRNGSEGEWILLQKTDSSFHHAVNRFHSAWKRDPGKNDFWWVNIVFIERPPDYSPPGPSDMVIGQLGLHRQRECDYTARYNGQDKDKVRELESTSTTRQENDGRRQPQPSTQPATEGSQLMPGSSNISRRPRARDGVPPSHGHRPAKVPKERLQRSLPRLPSGTKSTSTSSTKKQLLSALPKIQSKLRGIKDRITPGTPTTKAPSTRVEPPGEPAPPPAEPCTVLTALGAEIKQGGIHNLNGILPVMASPSPDQWARCCRLIPDLDPARLSLDARARSIRLPHSSLCITPVQFYSAHQMLQGGSGFLCHDMGLGKTHTVLATAALKALVVASKRRCDDDWASGFSSRHLPRAAGSREVKKKCPTQGARPGDVECFCVPGGATRHMYEELARSPGASLVLVPSSARGTWLEAIVRAEFRSPCYNFRFVSKSADVPAGLRCNLETTKTMLFRMGAVARTTTRSVRSALDLEWTSRSGLDGLASYVFVVLHGDTDWYSAFQYRPSDLRPRPRPDCVFTGVNGTCYAAPMGLTFVDEAHMPGLWRSTSSPMIMARYVFVHLPLCRPRLADTCPTTY